MTVMVIIVMMMVASDEDDDGEDDDALQRISHDSDNGDDSDNGNDLDVYDCFFIQSAHRSSRSTTQ